MEINVSGLSTNGFELALDETNSGPRQIRLGPSSGLTGRYLQTPEQLRFEHASVKDITVATLAWSLGKTLIRLGAEATLSQAAMDATIGRGEGAPGFLGTIAAGKVLLPEVVVQPGGAQEPLYLELELDTLRLAFHPDGTTQVDAERATLKEVRGRISGIDITARSARLEGVQIAIGQSTEVRFQRGSVLGLHLIRDGIELEGADIAFDKGFQFRNKTVEVGAISVGELRGDVELQSSKKSQASGSAGAAASSRKDQRAPLDYSFLDGAEGQLDVDVDVDATIPILGSLKLTNRFRIPIERGTLNFKQVERSLSFLADAALDFEVEEGRLILEKDLPLIPFDNQTLLFWPLSAADQALAEQERVRLAVLPHVQIGEDLKKKQAKKKSSESAVALRSIVFGGLKLRVALTKTHTLVFRDILSVTLGDTDRAPLGVLEVKGDMAYRPSDPKLASSLDFRVQDLVLGPTHVHSGTTSIGLSEVALDSADDGRVHFVGLSPTSAVATLRGLRLERVAVKVS